MKQQNLRQRIALNLAKWTYLHVRFFFNYFFILFFITCLCAAYRAGELPKYLREMKQKQEDKQKQDAMIDAACPAGHVALSNKERTEALIIAQQSNFLLISLIVLFFNSLSFTHRISAVN